MENAQKEKGRNEHAGFVLVIKIFPTAITVKSNKPIISRRHFIREPSCSFEGDVTTEY